MICSDSVQRLLIFFFCAARESGKKTRWPWNPFMARTTDRVFHLSAASGQTWKNLSLSFKVIKGGGVSVLNLPRATKCLGLSLITWSGFYCETRCCQGESNSPTALLTMWAVCVLVDQRVCVCVHNPLLLSTSSRVSLSPAMHRALRSGRLLGNPVALARHHSLVFWKELRRPVTPG